MTLKRGLPKTTIVVREDRVGGRNVGVLQDSTLDATGLMSRQAGLPVQRSLYVDRHCPALFFLWYVASTRIWSNYTAILVDELLPLLGSRGDDLHREIRGFRVSC